MLTDWFRANKLSLNVAKTNYMLFTYSSQQIDPQIDIHLANSSIKRAKCAKFLGIYIDEKLKWDEHIYNMNKKISKSFFCNKKGQTCSLTQTFNNIILLPCLPIFGIWCNVVGINLPNTLVKNNHKTKESS